MKILLLGATGQLGYELGPLLGARHEVVAPARTDLDYSDAAALRSAMERVRPELVVNAMAYNAVDLAESEPDAAFAINARAVAVMGEYARTARAALIHYSTDFVFDGTKGSPYVETDTTNPLSAYARSKLEGERLLAELESPAIVLRTAWVYSLRRKSFVSMILKLAREKEELPLVTDQVGSPTFARDLAVATAELVTAFGADPHARATEFRGVYHAAGGGACSRAELARATLELDPARREHTVVRLKNVTADAFPTPARRPLFAPLSCKKLEERLGISLPPWRDALSRALAS